MSESLNDADDETRASALPAMSTRTKVLVTAGLVALVAVVAWFAWGFADQDARWQDVGFTADSATEADVTFDVYLYTDEPVTCHLHALNVQYAEVGVAQIEVDPADGAQQRFTVPIATVEKANSALVRYCAVE